MSLKLAKALALAVMLLIAYPMRGVVLDKPFLLVILILVMISVLVFVPMPRLTIFESILHRRTEHSLNVLAPAIAAAIFLLTRPLLLALMVALSAHASISVLWGGLPAPKQLSPSDSWYNYNFPRTTNLVWSAVPGAVAYRLEIDSARPGEPCPSPDRAPDFHELRATDYSFDLGGSQAGPLTGCWRVWAVDRSGRESPRTRWWKFHFRL